MLSGFSLLSFEFVVLSIVAIVGLALFQGLSRQLAFLAFNLIFVWGMLLGPLGALSTMAFCIVGYSLVRVSTNCPTWRFGAGLTVFVLLFVYMQSYDFLAWALPDELLISLLRTVGLSFLFFKIIHVAIDARSGTLGEIDILTYLNYCLNFSTFLMGPIQRFQDYRSQWLGETAAIPLTVEAHLDVVVRILLGFVKVYVIADRLGSIALSPTTEFVGMHIGSFVLKMYAFYFYLYFNFGGYCDVVIGIGSLLGIRPPENFDKPFLSKNVSEFWLRMHRSLTLWLTDYVFSPTYRSTLSMKRLGQYPLLCMSFSLLVTMLVSGLWHGTTMSFLVFGIVHGCYLVIQRVWEAILTARLGRKGVRSLRQQRCYQFACMLLTFNVTAFAYVFFVLRWEDVVKMCRSMEFSFS